LPDRFSKSDEKKRETPQKIQLQQRVDRFTFTTPNHLTSG